MPLHPDPDDLALIALGESFDTAVDAHVAGCAHCGAEVESFRLTIGLAELSNYGEDAPRPAEHVWRAISDELGFAQAGQAPGAVATAVVATDATPPGGSASDSGLPADGTATNGTTAGLNGSTTPSLRSVPIAGIVGTGGADVPPVAPPAQVTRPDPSTPSDPGTPSDSGTPSASDPPAPTPIGAARSRRRARWVAPLAAAVVGIAVGAGAVVIAQNRSADVTVEAIAPLTPVAGGPLTADQQEQLGKAELIAAPSGQEVRVDAPALPTSSNDYEVWLFGNDGRMVSLGTLTDGSGTFTVPKGISTSEYRVVDVSDEPPDGIPTHSGVSLIRGKFS